MSRKKMAQAVLLVLLISACSVTQPFVDRRREAGKTGSELYVGTSKTDAPVICYNGWVTDFEEVQKMANDECIKHNTGTSASFETEENFSCRLFTPTYAKFQCVR
ncbi:MAG: hypothetical protein IJZ59_07555 [Alphaproteobacteria bacterium]|nr:hypothetical protein [Alphaproteobacteria bacterium]